MNTAFTWPRGRHSLSGGHDGEVAGGAGGPPGGGREQPDAPADPAVVDTFTDGVDGAGAVEVRGDLIDTP
ncbi:hypothetical protein ACFV5G_09265 [Streptomyces sp. NPDC059766]|uniref:hypothetical protein n=1 Tax=Streptomyces sp. NPDC059766 TaxID=3346940 RepID=UPI00364B370B